MFGKIPAVTFGVIATITIAAAIAAAGPVSAAQPKAPNQTSDSAAPAQAHQLGTIKTIHGTTITLTTDAGQNIDVQVADGTRIERPEKRGGVAFEGTASRRQDPCAGPSFRRSKVTRGGGHHRHEAHRPGSQAAA
jgi:hypothetical protein